MKSTDIIQPTAISQPIANTGTRNTISQTATGTGYASVAEGFPDVTMIAPADGGLPPRGEDCNGLFYLSTDQKAYLQNGGYITFNEEVSELIGGYPQGAMLDYYNSDTNVWAKVISLVDDNTNNFIDDPSLIDGTKWKYADIATTSWGSITGNIENQTDLQEVLNSLKNYIYNIGDPIITLSGTLNSNEIWLEGDEVSKTDYAALYEIYGDTYGTECYSGEYTVVENDEGDLYTYTLGDNTVYSSSEANIDVVLYLDEDFTEKYGTITDINTSDLTMTVAENYTSTTFVLPDFRGRAIWGNDSFGYIDAGLPSIAQSSSVEVSYRASNADSGDPGSYIISAASQAGSTYSLSGTATITDSGVYGNSDTVQPPAICVRVKTRYA